MARVGFKMRLKPGCEAIYQQKHEEIWPELTRFIHASGIRNYSIFRSNLDLFAYYETVDEVDASSPAADGADDSVQHRWWRMMEPYMEYNDDHTPRIWPMDEMFHQD